MDQTCMFLQFLCDMRLLPCSCDCAGPQCKLATLRCPFLGSQVLHACLQHCSHHTITLQATRCQAATAAALSRAIQAPPPRHWTCQLTRWCQSMLASGSALPANAPLWLPVMLKPRPLPEDEPSRETRRGC